MIVMDTALYGRMQLGRCISSKYGSTGCYADVLPIFDDLCSGKKQCQLRVPNEKLEGIGNCDLELHKYLETEYHCVEGTLGY